MKNERILVGLLLTLKKLNLTKNMRASISKISNLTKKINYLNNNSYGGKNENNK